MKSKNYLTPVLGEIGEIQMPKYCEQGNQMQVCLKPTLVKESKKNSFGSVPINWEVNRVPESPL